MAKRRSTLVADLSHNPVVGNLHHHTPPLPVFHQPYSVGPPPSSLHLYVGSMNAARHTPLAP